MRKLYINLLKAGSIFAVSGMGWFGQDVVAQTPVTNACGNDIHLLSKQYPDAIQVSEQFTASFRQWLQTADLSQFETSESGSRIIPVVVHVIHEGGTENITKAQIQSQIVAVNKDYQKLNANLVQLNSFPLFDTLVADCDIEFRLATKDPNGNCTDGIVRVFNDKTNEAKDFTDFKRLSYWDRSKYLNLWVVKSIYNDTQFGSILGYAQFPFPFGGQFPLTSTDGIAIISTSFGTIGTAVGGTGATMSHEAGHWLGLRHIWGDEECGSDGVDDTPIHKEPNFSGPTCFPLPKTATCYSPAGLAGQDSIDAVFNRDTRGEMWMDFMDYTDDNCLWMFTKGQKAVMDFVFTTYSFRGNLITPANNIATGTDDASYLTPCSPAPIADFWSSTGADVLFSMKLRCAGEDVQFSDGTFNGVPTTRDWVFEGGNPATSNTTNPLVTYDTPGIYDVTLTSTNSIGSNTKTRVDYVHILPATADENNSIYYDDFEWSTSSYVKGKWIHVNEGNQTNRWEHFTSGGYMSSQCVVMRNEGNIRFEKDALISASYDLTTFPNDKLYFRYAYGKKTNNPNVEQDDKLEVYVSTNCGESWSRRNITVDGELANSISGTALNTAGLYPNGFTPSSTADWKQASVDISTVQNADNVRIMFMWTSGGGFGNNFYLDQVNISNSQAIGVEEVNMGQTGFEVFPNPVSSVSQVYFHLLENSDVTIDLLDLAGREVSAIYSGKLNAGEQYFQVENSRFSSSGVYFVRLNINGVLSLKKIIVE
jgi:PKD repeat protein